MNTAAHKTDTSKPVYLYAVWHLS